ncbi:hypothetical protein GA707_13540 [Nostocoides sp. F2B08]|uniref:cell division protein PerM n=1 Tax=Nostocoides sp. F2B08 TaxID=2653936 RepID=UPI0012634633|nr:DUF6350 family protein [Tetrasphaera sp. F2B08]KAB7743623.1 hypothetical protein GA707_13540 [Tetrasphaera sp. F2B08]
MSPIDLLRRALPSTGSGADGHTSRVTQGPQSGSIARAALRGASTACATLVPVLLIASVFWVTTADPALGWVEASLAGAAFWLLAHGVPLVTGSGVLGIVPLGALLGVVALGTWSAGRATWAAAEHGYRAAGRVAAAWAAGYAGVLGLVGTACLAGPMTPHIGRWLTATVAVPALMGVVGMVRSLDHDDVDELLERAHAPAALRRGWRPALHATAVLLAAGTLAAVVAVGLSVGDVLALQSDLRPGLVGGVVLTFIQVMALPNLGLWILSFVAGPGFSVVDGAAVTWDGASTALVPMIPVLGAHPEPVAFPSATPLIALTVVATGAWLGWQSLAATARLASLRAKALTVLSAVASTGALIALLDRIGGGSLGMGRLVDVGAPAAILGLTVAGWLLLGAALVLAWDWRSLNR